MARVTSVAKARKSPGSCAKCNKKIEPGQPYIWWKFRYGGKIKRCTNCPRPRVSELIASDKLSRVCAAGESIEDALAEFDKTGELEDLKSAAESAAEELREVAQEYRDSADNVESGMNNRMPICDELEEKADNLESKADEIESAASDLEEFDEDAAREEAEGELDEFKEGDREAKIKELIAEKRQDWIERIRGEIEEFTDIEVEG